MKLAKKLVAHVLMIAMLLSLGAGVQFKDTTVKAAGVTDAILLPITGTWSQDYYITMLNNEQWFKIEVPSDGKIQIKLMHCSGVSWEVYTQNLEKKISDGGSNSGSDVSPVTDSGSEVISKGVYYIKVFEWNNHIGSRGGEGKYKINVSYENYNTTDGNANSYEMPQQYELGTSITGAITVTDLQDWYCFKIQESGDYDFKFIHYFGIQADLYEQDLNSVDYWYMSSGEENSPQADKYTKTLSAGTYYLKISESNNNVGSFGGNGKYIFSIFSTEKEVQNSNDNTISVDKLQITYLQCKNQKNTIKLKWIYVSDADGYQIRYSTNKKFKKAVKYAKVKSTKKTIKKLKRKKRYYVQVRAYKKVQGKIVYGKWSVKKNAKIK